MNNITGFISINNKKTLLINLFLAKNEKRLVVRRMRCYVRNSEVRSMNKMTFWLLKGFLYIIGGVVVLLSLFWLPSIAKSSALSFPEFDYLEKPVLIWTLATSVPYYFALFQSYFLLDIIYKGQAFSAASVARLGKIGWCGAIIAISYIILGIVLLINGALHPGILIALMAISLTATAIAFFAKLLSTLLYEAIQYKAENDLTV